MNYTCPSIPVPCDFCGRFVIASGGKETVNYDEKCTDCANPREPRRIGVRPAPVPELVWRAA